VIDRMGYAAVVKAYLASVAVIARVFALAYSGFFNTIASME
jgi:hypothetical protein